ncbi:SEC-C metal-binding domain-containing protein [Thiolapillus sp.]
MTQLTQSEPPFDIDRLLPEAVAAILELQDAEQFFIWMDENIHRYVTDPSVVQNNLFSDNEYLSEEMIRQFGRLFARNMWNITPLPRKNFQPDPLPAPGRNSPCPCGSGRKFKRCCQPAYTELPSLDTTGIWPVALDVMSDEMREKAVQSKHLPVEMLAMLADEHLQEDKPKKGLKLLEPLFDSTPPGNDERYDFALNTLCNIYDHLNYNKKKMRLLLRIINDMERSPLRSGAWQRLAAIKMDEGDNASAWQALQHAQRDDPGNPYTGVLEMQLLIAEGRTEEARNRAMFWQKQLHRYDADSELVDFFADIARDPHQAFMQATAPLTAEADQRLQNWIEQVANRPLPEYSLNIYTPDADFGADDDEYQEQGIEQTRQQLQKLGIPTESIDELLNQIPGLPGTDGEQATPDQPTSASLVTPNAIAQLEMEWMEVYPSDKPFSIAEVSFSDADPWEPPVAAKWLGWLEQNPQAFDSLSLLDDIATALLDHPSGLQPWLVEKFLLPILTRANQILEHALESADSPLILEWPMPENRPALRSLARMIQMSEYRRDETQTIEYAKRLLALNPTDNHGVRTLVMNHLLQQNQNEEAIELADQYPDDLNPELPFGQALAYYRLGETDIAEEILAEATSMLPKVAPMLLRKSVKKTKDFRTWLADRQQRPGLVLPRNRQRPVDTDAGSHGVAEAPSMKMLHTSVAGEFRMNPNCIWMCSEPEQTTCL